LEQLRGRSNIESLDTDGEIFKERKPMRIAIFGSGGVGGYFGGRLALAGEDVTFIARDEHT
jgi:pyruvate/2-oxoglutarate dehydrogenase complex dihydrolipoamide dehydrogenase (E3) component